MSKLVLKSKEIFNEDGNMFFPNLMELTSEIFDEFSYEDARKVLELKLKPSELELDDYQGFIFDYEGGLLDYENAVVVFLEEYTKYVVDKKYKTKNNYLKFLKSIDIYMKALEIILKAYPFVGDVKYTSLGNWNRKNCECVSVAIVLK